MLAPNAIGPEKRSSSTNATVFTQVAGALTACFSNQSQASTRSPSHAIFVETFTCRTGSIRVGPSSGLSNSSLMTLLSDFSSSNLSVSYTPSPFPE